jgi:hypothetical protein
MMSAVFLVVVLSLVALTSIYRAERSVSTDRCLRFNGIEHIAADQAEVQRPVVATCMR